MLADKQRFIELLESINGLIELTESEILTMRTNPEFCYEVLEENFGSNKAEKVTEYLFEAVYINPARGNIDDRYDRLNKKIMKKKVDAHEYEDGRWIEKYPKKYDIADKAKDKANFLMRHLKDSGAITNKDTLKDVEDLRDFMNYNNIMHFPYRKPKTMEDAIRISKAEVKKDDLNKFIRS